MNNEQILSALAMDLKRIALGLHRGSINMAQRFEREAEKRLEEVEERHLMKYMINTLIRIRESLSLKDKNKKADDMLMYSTIIQNYVLYK